MAGPVEWEIIDVGRIDSVDGNRSMWSYTIVLKETAGVPIQFERIERGAQSPTLVSGGIGRTDFTRRLEARGELRYSATDDWGWVRESGPQFGGISQLGALTMERHFIGKDPQGQAVVVPVRVALDRSFGRKSRQPSRGELATPPAKSLQPQDLKSLAGRWEGYYRTRNFEIPIEAIIREDGSVDVGEYDPVTNRFRRTLSVREGRVWVSARDTIELTYHEGGGRYVLAGHLIPATGADAAARLPMWLERTASPPATVTPSPTRDASLRGSARTAFEAFKTDPKYTHFKAFATDRFSDMWGRAWGLGSAIAAMDRALEECRRRGGGGCDVYAVGDTVLESVSAEQQALLRLAGVPLTYKGELTVEQEGRAEQSSATFYFRQGATELTGSWQRPDPLTSGVFTGDVSERAGMVVRMTQSAPCLTSFSGILSLRDGGTTLAVSYTGPGCDGVPIKARFTGIRQ